MSGNAAMLKQVVNPTYAPITHPATPFGTFEAFYPFYLGEHSNRVNRIFHLVGTSVALTCHARVVAALVSYLLRRQTSVQVGPEVGKVLNRLALSAGEAGKVFLTGIIGAYTCAWIGHFFVEKNRPATFKYPLFSLRGDFRMLWEVLSLQRSL
ncbi:hypothetical protein NliqN6_1468 [Naganishia liquefaciens]|uniref:DUF962 domain-containing protein n=1 Tax=Naganishia liquefaciens TaxID=104408 RepID=A0A8H3TPN9_9TREE|nr:hypothetical protein NliqN6_1468 [Naganishia liquefaciens]